MMEQTMTEDWEVRSKRAARAIRGAWIGTLIASIASAIAFAVAMQSDGVVRLTALAVAAGGIAIAFAYGTYIYMRRIDELEREANLWGAYAGVSIYIALFTVKTVLAPIGIVFPYADAGIFVIVLMTFVAVFCWKRFR
jgi:hypothetical protein